MSNSNWTSILDDDEEIIWQGRPDGALRFKAANVVQSAFGIFFLGFSIFWTYMASGGVSSAGNGPPFVFGLFGLPFIGVGLYLVFGTHIFDAYKRRRTHYTLTGKRAFIATDVFGRKLKSYPIEAGMPLEFRPGPPDSVMFAEEFRRTKNGSRRVPIGFEYIDNGQLLYQLVREVQKANA